MAEAREQFRVVIRNGVWRRFEVAVEPPQVAMPPRSFRDHAAALRFASELAALQGGWAIVDLTRHDV